MSDDRYSLLDFGNGRKLERFGGVVLDRPCPAAEGTLPLEIKPWRSADGRYLRQESGNGRWEPPEIAQRRWTVSHRSLVLRLKPAPFGHTGLFPEQIPNWDWLAEVVSAAARPLRILNLFAYTGGATLACAAAGAAVVHVDAAKGAILWARRNARLSGLDSAPIRWLHEDALKFARRENRRKNRYDGIILDPPSYGHGPRGEVWRIDEHLPMLLKECRLLLSPSPPILLVTCHSPGHSAPELSRLIADEFRLPTHEIESRELLLLDRSGRGLPSGAVCRISPAGRRIPGSPGA